jgi:cbb3-type cytochrome oxidase maturation protein
MDVLYLLIPLSVLLVLALLGLFAWALARGQFDDLEREGERILERDAVASATGEARSLDPDQAVP